ncbi:MAG: hypothetical protein LBS31_03480 [Candidatus Adiutrix sp.]|nr:hypothetical protein [Candidatus Adiutrix sp.]
MKTKSPEVVSGQYDYEAMHQNIAALIDDIQKTIYLGHYRIQKFFNAFDRTVILKRFFYLDLKWGKFCYRLIKSASPYFLPPVIITAQRERLEEYINFLHNNMGAVPLDLRPILEKDFESLQDMLRTINEAKDNIRKYFINYQEEYQLDLPRFISKVGLRFNLVMLALTIFVWVIPALFYSNQTIVALVSLENIFPFMKRLSEVSIFPDMTLMMLSQAFYGSILYGVYRCFNSELFVCYSRFWFVRYCIAIILGFIFLVIYLLSDGLMGLWLVFFKGQFIVSFPVLSLMALAIYMLGEFFGNVFYFFKRDILPLLTGRRVIEKPWNLR